jgi:sRNA-binding protein
LNVSSVACERGRTSLIDSFFSLKRLSRTENREYRAERREQRAESREQRAESREQRAESREQRAESRERTSLIDSSFSLNRPSRTEICSRVTF